VTIYQIFSEMDADQYAKLKDSIRTHGILIPLEYDDAGNLLDGHHRLRAYNELKEEGCEITYPSRLVRSGLGEDEKLEHVDIINRLRRHLTPAQREQKWVEMRQQGMSYRKIAEEDGDVSHMTVASTVKRFTVDLPETIVGKDGKKRQSYKSPPAPRDEAEEQGGLRHVSTFIDAMGLEHLRPQQPDLPEPESAPLPHNHRAQGSGENEWYTPEQYLTAARKVLGAIDLDPASSEIANQAVRAARFFSMDDDGLDKPWAGRIWMNPPYSQPHIARFAAKLVEETQSGNVSEAIALTHNYTDTAWFHALAGACDALCFTRGRIGFLSPDGRRAAPTQGQAFFYFGPRPSLFAEVFASIGLVLFTPIGAARSDAA